jgi:hypothetical protein
MWQTIVGNDISLSSRHFRVLSCRFAVGYAEKWLSINGVVGSERYKDRGSGLIVSRLPGNYPCALRHPPLTIQCSLEALPQTRKQRTRARKKLLRRGLLGRDHKILPNLSQVSTVSIYWAGRERIRRSEWKVVARRITS